MIWLLVFLLISTIVFTYTKLDSLQSKINSLSNEVYLLKNPCERINFETANKVVNFKDDFLNEQISNSTTLLLSVIGFALVFAGFFTYFFGKSIILDVFKRFKSETNHIRADFRKGNKTNEEAYNNIRVKHNDLEFSLLYNQGNFYANLYNKYLDEKNTEMFLYYALCSFSDFTNCCLSESIKNNDDFKNDKIVYIKNGLQDLVKVSKYKVKIDFSGTTHNNISNIRRLEDVEIDILLSKLQASIEYIL